MKDMDDDWGDMDFDFGDEDIIEVKNKEISEALRKFKESAKKEEKTFLDNVDSEFWVALCFGSREQKEEFLEKAGWLELGDKYLDGEEVAEKMGIRLGKETGKHRYRISKVWKDFV